MATVTGQPFQEAIDGIRTLFTAQEPFEPESVQVFQNSLALLPGSYIELDDIHVRIVDPDSHKSWSYGVLPSVCYSAAHGFVLNDPVVVWSTKSNGLPDGLDNLQEYFVRDVTPDTFSLSESVDGPAVLFSQSSLGILFAGSPVAPLVENGPVHYNAETTGDPISSNEEIGFWNISEFQAQYAPGTSLQIVRDSLLDADDAVRRYVTEEYYAQAETGVHPYRIFRRVIGELAFKYLSNRPGAIKQTSSSKKAYGDNVKKMEQTYKVVQSSILVRSEDQILAQLYDFRAVETIPSTTTAGALTDSWGSMRNFGY